MQQKGIVLHFMQQKKKKKERNWTKAVASSVANVWISIVRFNVCPFE